MFTAVPAAFLDFNVSFLCCRLEKKEGEGSGKLLQDLQSERDARKSLETQVCTYTIYICWYAGRWKHFSSDD
jgi:hypothetical protein